MDGKNIRVGIQTVAPVLHGVDFVSGAAQSIDCLPHCRPGDGQQPGDLLSGKVFPFAALQQSKQIFLGAHCHSSSETIIPERRPIVNPVFSFKPFVIHKMLTIKQLKVDK